MTVWKRVLSTPQNTDLITIVHDRLDKQDGTSPGVLLIGSHGAWSDNWQLAARFGQPDAIARRRFICVGTDSGSTWGNDTAMAYYADGHDILQRLPSSLTASGTAGAGAKAGKIGLYGNSMGGTGALNYAKRHLAQISCIALVCPAVDVELFRATNGGGFGTASVEAAYTNNATWQAARPTRNPVEFAAELAAIPIIIFSASDDPLIPPSTHTAFAAAHGNTEIVNMGAVGHTFTAAPPEDVADWMTPYLLAG